MNEELITKQIETHDRRLNDHSKRIDLLEQHKAATDVRIDNLCDKLEKQTKSINGLIAAVLSSLLGFFIYVIQQNIFN